MCACNTNCIEKPISIGFKKLGFVIGKYPWVFLVLPFILSGGLGGGFYFLGEREANDIEDQFTPTDGQAKTEREYIKTHFPHSEEFSPLRLYTEGEYASIIAVNSSNILNNDVLKEVVELDRKIRSNIKTEEGNTYAELCAKAEGKCVLNAVLDIVGTATSVGYPSHHGTFLGSALGGVSLKRNGTIDRAKAIRLFYYLNDANRTENDAWLRAFKTFSENSQHEMISLSYFTSNSRAEEFDRNSETVIPFFSITYALAINTAVISCLRLDCVRSKVWVALVGVLSAGLAVLASFGLLLFCGMPFSMTVASAPFLILGIGVDDMFIMISCWQKTKVHDKVEDRMAETYREAAVSITITTLTDCLAFYIGLLTPFRSVQSFCMYTGTAILFCYIYNITFFGAFLALNGQRERDNRHWLTCSKVKVSDENNKSNACSIAKAYDKSDVEEEMPVNVFFKNYYGPFLTNRWTKMLVVVFFAGYLAGSIYGCFQMEEGIDLKNLAPDDSYVASYYDNEDKYFSDYGPFVMLVIKDKKFQYWEKSARDKLNKCLNKFESSDMVAKNMTVSWLQSYLNATPGLSQANETFFMAGLPEFLEKSGFMLDVNISKNTIQASRMFIPTVNISSSIKEKEMLNFFRHTASNCVENMDLLVYHPAFIYFDQYAVIVSNTIQNIAVATAAMLVISLLLIPHPLCSLWVTFAIASVIVGVAGFMALWDVNLDSISMINLVICIGFSVDFSAHISYAFVSSEKKTANEKAIDAIYKLGYPIVQGAVSTIAGIVVLSAAQSYIFRTFFKIMFMVILFGAAHGLVFIPVFLTFFGVCGNSSSVEDKKGVMNHSENTVDTSVRTVRNSNAHYPGQRQGHLQIDNGTHYNEEPRTFAINCSNNAYYHNENYSGQFHINNTSVWTHQTSSIQVVKSTSFKRDIPFRTTSIQTTPLTFSKQNSKYADPDCP